MVGFLMETLNPKHPDYQQGSSLKYHCVRSLPSLKDRERSLLGYSYVIVDYIIL